ncbi:hypothetical protein HDU98_002862, partial [Podochytrium sp. JEL0797]
MLNRVLDRQNARILIDKAQINGGTEHDADKVKAEVDRFMANWFRERPAKVIPAGSIIENAYKPREDVEESWFEGVTNEVSLPEVERAIGNMGANKAPGPSGVPKELIIGAGEEALAFL